MPYMSSEKEAILVSSQLSMGFLGDRNS